MKNKKLKCSFCDNNGASHIECRYGKIELVYDVDEICFYFKEEK